jgi:hypothetical protein
MSKEITIMASSTSGWVNVFADGNQVLEKPGTSTITLDDGAHSLTYFVQGKAGDDYEVSIADPAWAVQGTLSSNHTTGQHGFTI